MLWRELHWQSRYTEDCQKTNALVMSTAAAATIKIGSVTGAHVAILALATFSVPRITAASV